MGRYNMSIDYFQRFLAAYDGDSKEVREQLNNAIMREKENAITVAGYLLEALQDECQAEIRDTKEQTHTKIYRLMEINNLMQCVRGYRDMIESVTQEKFDGWMERIYKLINRPTSYGNHELCE